jgi:hypothetical protein
MKYQFPSRALSNPIINMNIILRNVAIMQYGFFAQSRPEKRGRFVWPTVPDPGRSITRLRDFRDPNP